MAKFATPLLLMLFSFLHAKAQLSVAHIFTDHAVLQRDKPLPIWGQAKPGASVSVTLNGLTKSIKTDAQGQWKVQFLPMDAGGPYAMRIQSDKSTIELQDIYIGEVWICSGQSNMEWPLSLVDNAITEVKRAKDSKIRHIKLNTDLSLSPKNELVTPRTPWTACSPKTAGDFSAVGYFFAQNLRKHLGEDVAIGLINSTWGGSQLESWISTKGMAATPALQPYAENYPNTWEQSDILLKNRIVKYCYGERMQADSQHQEAQYTQPGYDFSHWPEGEAPLAWDWQGIWAFRGNGYMARTIDVAEFLLDSSALIRLGYSDQPMRIWINGVSIPVDTSSGLITARIAPGIFKAGKNSLMLYIGAQKDPDWWGMGLHGAPNEIQLSWGDFVLPLHGEHWHIMPSWNTPHQFARLQNNVAATLYNAMIHPITPLAMRGVLWYQGESNAERAVQYRETFPALIQDWRNAWQDEFPFLFVQLSAFGKDEPSNKGSKWAELREAQTKALELANTAMAVTLDIGDAADIHPRNKQDVGKRLALAALNKVYYKDIDFASPTLLNITWEAASAVLTFENTGKGLKAKDKYGYVRGFEIAGDDHVFHYAQAEIINERQILVRHPEGSKPASVRYAWSDAPIDANVFNSADLPLGTFRTDDWKCRTAGKRFE